MNIFVLEVWALQEEKLVFVYACVGVDITFFFSTFLRKFVVHCKLRCYIFFKKSFYLGEYLI